MNKDLAALFQALGNGWRLLSTIKNNLAQSMGFRATDLFKQINSRGRGAIELKDLYQFLVSKGIQPSQGEIFTIFKELDLNKKGYISAADFCDYFSNSIDGQASSSKLEFGEIDLVKKFFNQLIDNHRRLEGIRLKLTKFSPQELYKQLLTSSQGVVEY